MRAFKWIVAIVLLVSLTLFATLNARSVSFHYVFGHAELPLVLLLLFAFVVGLLISMLWLGPGWLRWRWKAHQLQNHLLQSEQELLLLKGPTRSEPVASTEQHNPPHRH